MSMSTVVSADVDPSVSGEWWGCSDDELEAELCGVAARVAAMTCRFLLAVAEYDRREAWQAWECHDMAGWLAWKCGISPVTAREQVRVGRALARLPVLRERFGAGQLSYSQTRAIARSATPETEAQLVELAAVMTAAQLETMTRAYRRCAAAAQETAGARDRARGVTWSWDDDGSLVGRFRLPAEQGAALINAVTARVERAAVDAADSDGAADPVAAVSADALVDLITAGATATDDTTDDSRYLVTIVADAAVLAGADTDGVCQVADGPGLAAETARRIACDATTVTIVENTAGHVVDVGRRTRRPNRRLRTALQRRDQHCQYPGCTRRRTQAHHIVHWIDGGATTMANLTSMCSRHHHRLHEGRFRIEQSPTGQLLFYRPDGRPVPTVVNPTPVADLTPDPNAPVEPFTSNWDGSRLDLSIIIEGLLHADGLLQTHATT